jgi:imidazole glycerol-phosphate synthase subunit HisF
VQFSNLQDAGNPVALAKRYEADGADELVMLDISASAEKRRTGLNLVSMIRRVLSIPFTVGGGVASVEDVQRLLEAGADKVSLNTAAVRRPGLISEVAARFGSQCAVAAIDARRSAKTTSGYEVVIVSGKEATGLDALEWARRAEALGAGEILLTSLDRDGTGEGYELKLLRLVSKAVQLPIVASGGGQSAAQLAQAYAAGASALLAAGIFHRGVTSVQRLKEELNGLGVAVRK